MADTQFALGHGAGKADGLCNLAGKAHGEETGYEDLDCEKWSRSPRQIPWFSRQGPGHAATLSVLGRVPVVQRVLLVTAPRASGTGI